MHLHVRQITVQIHVEYAVGMNIATQLVLLTMFTDLPIPIAATTVVQSKGHMYKHL